MAAVGEHRELDALRAAVIEQRVDGRARGAAGEHDVVDQDHRAAVEVEVEVRAVDDRLGARLAVADVVAVEGDVEVAERHLGPAELADERVQPAGQHRPAGVDADQRDRLRLGVLLDDLVRDPHERAAQIVPIEDNPLGLVFHARPFLASLDRVKGTDASSLAPA